MFQIIFSHFIIVWMSNRVNVLASEVGVVQDREKVTDAKRKIGILKEALVNERHFNRQLEEKLYDHNEKLKKMEAEGKKREQKNEALLIEIRSLRDALINEKNEKQNCIQSLKQIEQQQKSLANGDNKKSFNNMFGLKNLFQK